MPVNPYDDRKVSLQRPHGNGDLDIVGASYTRRKANVTEALWPFQIINQMVYLDHMGKNRFSKTIKIFVSETTRLIALIFCVELSSIYLPFLFKLCPWGHKLSRPRVHMFYIGMLVCRV